MRSVLCALITFLFVCSLSIADVSATLLIIAPHPDDEALMFSGIINGALQQGEKVKVAVLTNGDYYGTQSGYTRENETVSAMGMLGMNEQDIIFLGYPDAGLKTIYDYYTTTASTFTSRAGQTATYARRGLGGTDYHTYRFGMPATYNKPNIVTDLKTLIGDYQPNHIFLTNEYDTHTDHATVYRLVHDALLELMADDPGYKPLLHHTMIHSGSEAIWPTQSGADPTTLFPLPPTLYTTPLKWENRESINVPLDMQAKVLSDNLKYLAINAYVTQVDNYLRSFVHKDEFFWPENLYSTNGPPVSNAGTDRIVTGGSLVTLDGTASFDPNNDSLTYKWRQLQGFPVTLSSTTSATPSFVAPASAMAQVFQLIVSDGTLNSYPATVTVNVAGQEALPAPWTKQDIGLVGVAGDASFQSGTFSVKGSGVDIWDRADSFQYAYQSMDGDGQIVARVVSEQNVDPWSKAGVMIRASVAANAPHAYMAVTPGNGAAFQRRLTAGALSLHTAGPKINVPYWVKLVRSGNTFTGYVSPDGATWTMVGSDTIPMASPVLVGMGVTSGQNTILCNSTFDSVKVSSIATGPTVTITGPANGASFTAPATIPITTTATAGTGATVSRVDLYAASSLIGTVSVSPYNFTWSQVPAGTYSLTARVTDSFGATAVSTPLTVIVNSGETGLPSPWTDQDIGSVGVVGDAGYANGTFSLSGSGVDIWDYADSFHYAYQAMNGDGQIIARISTLQNVDSWSKAGIMIRATTATDSPHAYMAITPGNGAAFQRRRSTGGLSYHTAGPKVTAPYWVKLVRSGNTFTGSVSTDGVTWTVVGSDTVPMAAPVLVGLAITSGVNKTLCTTSIDGVKNSSVTTLPAVNITSPPTGASFMANTNIPITVTASGGTGATVSKVDFYSGATLIGSATAAPFGFTWNNVPAGSYSLTAKITDSLGATATSIPVSITVSNVPSSLPAPWTQQDVGTVGIAGDASYFNGTFSVSGTGWDIWDHADGFHFVYQPMTGDGQIIARVASLQNVNEWSKAGVMIRATAASDSPHAYMAITPGNGAAFQRRRAAGGLSYHTAGPNVTAPYWVKLVRSGDTFTGYVSSDGATWTAVGSDTVPMAASVLVGLAITSEDNGHLCTTTIDGVKIGN